MKLIEDENRRNEMVRITVELLVANMQQKLGDYYARLQEDGKHDDESEDILFDFIMCVFKNFLGKFFFIATDKDVQEAQLMNEHLYREVKKALLKQTN